MEHKIGSVLEELLRLRKGQSALVRKSNGELYSVSMFEKTTGNTTEEYPFLKIKLLPSCLEYGIVQIHKDISGLFPGYKTQFILETDVKPFVMHVTGGSRQSRIGELDGNYLCHPDAEEIEPPLLEVVPDAADKIEGSFRQWYRANPELSAGTIVRIYRIHSRLYELKIDRHRNP